MIAPRSAPLFVLALSLGCARPTADTTAPETPGPATASAALPLPVDEWVEETAAVAGDQPVAQTITFSADPESATQIQGAPKRPPLPRFRLFGTRASDGPN